MNFFLFFLHLFRQAYEDVRHRYHIFLLQKKHPTLKIGKNVRIKSIPFLHIGKNVSIQDDVVLHCGGMEWCNQQGGIILEDNVIIGPSSILWGTGATITIGTDSRIGQAVHIYASTEIVKEQPDDQDKFIFAPIHIGHHSIVYSNAIISSGVTIGNYARVAAGSVVVKNVDHHEMVGGVPAKPIGKRLYE